MKRELFFLRYISSKLGAILEGREKESLIFDRPLLLPKVSDPNFLNRHPMSKIMGHERST